MNVSEPTQEETARKDITDSQENTEGPEDQHSNHIDEITLPSKKKSETLEDIYPYEAQDEDPYLERIAIQGRGWRRMKVLFLCLGISVSIGVRFMLPVEHVGCIQDKTHEMLAPANDFLHRHSDAAFYIKFIFTLMIDITVVTLLFHWVFISLKWQFAFEIALFFSIRNAEGIYWPESSFMSLSNAGLSEQQYQVSGYTGILMINFLYWTQQDQSKYLYDIEKFVMSVIALFCLLFSILVELSFRISYCTDIFAAIMIAHLCNIAVRGWSHKFDEKFNEFLRKKWSLMMGKDDHTTE